MRWPGGSPANQYIWDGNWSAHPYFEKWEGQYGSDYVQTADELILTCKATGAEALIQMNAALALVEGVPASLDLSLRLLRKLTAAKVRVRHVSFGNEDYGPWETPYGDVPVDGKIYGNAFSKWVDGMRAEFPNISYGVVGVWTPSDGAVWTRTPPDEWCPSARDGQQPPPLCATDPVKSLRIIKDWMPDMLSKTDAVKDADWLVIHDYFTKSPARLTNAQLLNNTQVLHLMPQGVANFIRDSAPATPMPRLAVTEFNIATTYSGSANSTARLVNALFLGTLIGEALTKAPVAALTEFGWHAKWTEKSAPDRSGSYGMVTFGEPSWAEGEAAGTPLPKFFAQSLFKLATGNTLVSAGVGGSGGSGAPATLKAYATEFYTGELGVVMINQAESGVRVSLSGLAYTPARAARFVNGVHANAWVLEANASTVVPLIGATSLLDASGVTVNRVGNGGMLGGPWPLIGESSTIVPYSLSATSASQPLDVDVPAASMVALIVHGARPANPSPPPLPPFPPPSPPPPCFTANYAPCFDSHCCENLHKFGCYKRPTLQFAQCRPLQHNCTDTTDWLCPGWWEKEGDVNVGLM